SLFDYTTFFIMLYVFNCWDISTPQAAVHSASLFQTGWFVESLLTQTLIIHVIRTNKIPLLQSRSSWPMLAMSLVIMATGIAIPFSPVGSALGFTKLPALYWPLLGVTLLCYVLVTQGVKMVLLRRKWILKAPHSLQLTDREIAKCALYQREPPLLATGTLL